MYARTTKPEEALEFTQVGPDTDFELRVTSEPLLFLDYTTISGALILYNSSSVPFTDPPNFAFEKVTGSKNNAVAIRNFHYKEYVWLNKESPYLDSSGARQKPTRNGSSKILSSAGKTLADFLFAEIGERAKGTLLRCSEPVGLLGALTGVLLLETVDASGGIDELLFACEEGVAARADFDADVAFVGGASFERVSARADHVHLVVCRVNSSFHFISSGIFMVTQVPENA